MNVGVIGTGTMGRNHVRIYIEDERYTQENIIEKVLVNKVEPLKGKLKAFIKCVEKGEEFTITLLQALNNLRICEEIGRSNGIL